MFGYSGELFFSFLVVSILSTVATARVAAQEWKLRHTIVPVAEQFVVVPTPPAPGDFGSRSWSGIVADNQAVVSFRRASNGLGAILVFDTLTGKQLPTVNANGPNPSEGIGDFVATNGDVVATDRHLNNDVRVFAIDSGRTRAPLDA